ncbi:hypothetical protein, partial [uncultured Duncaniella sp.]
SQAEPESDVLPLHHKAIFIVLSSGVALFPFDGAKVGVIFELCKFFQSFFQKSKKNSNSGQNPPFSSSNPNPMLRFRG